MRKFYLLILFNLIMFTYSDCQAQMELRQNDIDTLFVKALGQRVDWMLSSGYKYVDLEDQSKAAQKNNFGNMIKVLPHNEIIKVSRKENKELTVYTMECYIVSNDTVDVNFSEYKLEGLKAKTKNSAVAEITKCKCGTENYEPDVRFVWNNGKWEIIKSKFMRN